MAYYSRRSWTSASNGAVAIKQTQRHVTLHYPGFGSNSVVTANWSRKRCLDQIASWRRMHVPSAYREIAYNFFALPTGDFVEGRGLRQNGANGTSAANRAGLSIQVLIGDNEALSPGHIKAVNDCLAHIAKRYPQAVRSLRGHQQWVSTRCPGPYVMAGLKAGKFGAGRGSSGGTVSPSRPADPGRPWLTSPRVNSMPKADVKAIQAELAGAGYPLGSHGVDGSYGDATGAAVKQLQTDLGLEADGIYGPGTEKALMTLKKDIDWVRRVVEENQKRITDARAEIDWVRRVAEANQRRIDRNERRVSSITRGGKEVSLRQEIADAKTFAMANAAQIASISKLLADADVDATEAKVPEDPEG